MAPDTEINRVCFVCVKQLNFVNTRDSSSPISLNRGRDPVLYSKFFSFVRQYLGITDEEDKAEGGFEGFCEPCAKRVSLICNLHRELCAVELHLSSKLKELGKLIKETSYDKQCSSSTLKKKLRNVEELRNQIFVKCFQKCGLFVEVTESENGPEPGKEGPPDEHDQVEDIKPDLETLQNFVNNSIFTTAGNYPTPDRREILFL